MTTPQINSFYNVGLYPNPVVGSSYKNLKLKAILDYYSALKYANVELLGKQIYPYLPDGTLRDRTKYTYYLFEDVYGKNIVLAHPWITPGGLVQTSGMNYTIDIYNVDTTTLTNLQTQLRLLGITYNIRAT